MPVRETPDNYLALTGEITVNTRKFGVGASVSMGRTISESDVYLFGGLTGDLARHHIDEEYARKNTYFGRRVVHGALLVGLASAASSLMGDRYDKGKWRGASYGYDHVRFVRPVFIGDTVTVTYTIKTMDEADLKTYADVVAVNQHGETVFVAVHIAKGVAKPAAKSVTGSLVKRAAKSAVELVDESAAGRRAPVAVKARKRAASK